MWTYITDGGAGQWVRGPTWVVEAIYKTFINRDLESGDMILRELRT